MEELVDKIYNVIVPKQERPKDQMHEYGRFRTMMNVKLEIADLIEDFLNPVPQERLK